MGGEEEIQQKIRRIGTLVSELDWLTDNRSKTTARELIQLLMDVHGTGLERMMEIVFGSGTTGEKTISQFGLDPIVRNLLLLHSLHPDDLETRVLQALAKVAPRLRKFDCTVELAGIQDGAVELRILAPSHGCGSTARNLKAMVEESVYELAPDLTSLSIQGLEDENKAGFVPLETLLTHPTAAFAAHGGEGSMAG